MTEWNKKSSIRKTKKLKFALEGLSCSSCSMTVNDAMVSFSSSASSSSSSSQKEEMKNIQIHPDSIRVSLLPNPQLELLYSILMDGSMSHNVTIQDDDDEETETETETTTVENTTKDEVRMESILTNEIINVIESIGFEAELLSITDAAVEGKEETKSKNGGMVEDKHKEDDDPIRSLYLSIQCNINIVHELLENMDHIHSVRRIDGTKKNDKDKRSTVNIDKNGTIEISYDCNHIGIRTILSQIETNPTLQSQGGCGGNIQVTDVSSYQNMLAKAEARRKTEINQYFHSFLISACCAVPVTLVSMVFVHIPGMKEFLHSYIIWNINWEECIAWVLTTPVQFYSGARFYREAYYSIKSRHLGMGFLIAAGTSAAYFYSVFVIFYNASRDAKMGDRLMQAFETSALLIMFVLLGKYLECRVKSFTSKAISKLSQLTPDTATLVGTTNGVDFSKIDSYKNGEMKKEEGKEGRKEEFVYASIPEEQIPIILLQKNDVLFIRPGEKVPTDGIVIQGKTSTDESMLTGESMPVHKEEGDLVIGGTINIDGAVHIEVNAIGKETALSKIIELIESAQSSKAPIQEFADKIASKFVPVVTGIAVLTYVTWAILLNTSALDGVKDTWPYKDEGLNDWTLPLLFSISCLVIACPCALGLATPTAVMVGSGVSSTLGILIKGGEALEAANNISVVVFDKTGTLTYGTPVVKDVLLLSDRCAFLGVHSNEEGKSSDMEDMHDNDLSDADNYALINEKALRAILRFAACAEYGSEHPLAKGIMAKAAEFDIGEGYTNALFPTEDFVAEVGLGIKCKVNGYEIVVGNRRSLENNSIEVRKGTFRAMEFLENRGQTAIVVSIDGYTEAVVGLSDKAREESALVIKKLADNMGIESYMLTGDNNRTAQVVASEIGIRPDHVISDVLPEGKVNCIKELQSKGETVAMIGDGVNDSPAMAQADVGIAIGAGADVAKETASIILLNSKLTDVIVAIDLSRKVFTRIKWNFAWALGYNSLAIPIAAGLLYPVLQIALPPFMAAVAMIMSSLSVLISSLLLNLYKPEKHSNEIAQTPSQADMVLGDIETGQVMIYNSSQVASMCSSMNDKLSDSSTNMFYPGCSQLWDDPCCCAPLECKCGSACPSTKKKVE